MRFIKALLNLFLALGLFPAGGQSAYPSLTFKGQWVFEATDDQSPPVGGLSELFFDERSGYFFALSDDKSRHRFYKLALKTSPQYHFEFKESIFLRSPGQEGLDFNMDPEALALYRGDWIIASEGQQIFDPPQPTQIFSFDSDGVLKSQWPVPDVFWREGASGPSGWIGPQSNKGFESLTLDLNRGKLWTATEEPLRQDLAALSHRFVRLSLFDISQKQMREQYFYPLDSEAGLTALQLLDSSSFVALERSFLSFLRRFFMMALFSLNEQSFLSMERVYQKTQSFVEDKKNIYKVRIFWTDCQGADNVAQDIKPKRDFTACGKRLLWDSAQMPHLGPDNLEGMALGPRLDENRRLLVLVSDNNFQAMQKTQFLFFELSGG